MRWRPSTVELGIRSGAVTEDTSIGFVVRPGTSSDAQVAARLHASQITEGFLPTLGPRFLARLYRRITIDPGSFLFLAEDQGQTAGFIAGSVDVRRLYKTFLLRDGARALLSALPTITRGWRKVLETLGHGSGDVEGAELLSVAVDPAWQGHGVGQRLVEAFLTEVGNRSVDRANVVVGASNAAAIALYRRSGFREIQQMEVHAGTRSLLMGWEARKT